MTAQNPSSSAGIPADDPILPSAIERAKHYSEGIERLRARFPNAILPNDDLALETYLKDHIWSKNECLDAIPWSRKYFDKYVRDDLPCIVLNQYAAETYPRLYARLSRIAQNAQILYAPLDLAAWVREHFKGTIETVLVPLSFFTKRPREFREAFVRERDERRERGELPGNKWLHKWNCCKDYLEESSNDVVGHWFDDIATKAREQGKATNRIELEKFDVSMPPDLIPRFYTLEQVGMLREYGTPDAGATTIRSFGFAKWKREGETSRKCLYTKGLAVFGKNYYADYALGLLDLMTVERFVDTFGKSGLDDATWLIGSDEVVWSEEPYKEVPKLPMMELASLLAVRHDRQGRVARF